MCAVYQNSFLTIPATRCEGSMDNLPSFQRTVRGSDEMGNPLTVAIRSECLYLDSQHSKYPLLTRGWIFQERLLSRRIFPFGYDELFWECIESTSCECAVEIVRGGLSIKSSRNRNFRQGTRMNKRRIWSQLVAYYTNLDLTYAFDRQMAILGLAKKMRPYREG